MNIATITLVLRQRTNLPQWQVQRRNFCLRQPEQTNLIHINMWQWMMGSEGRVVATAVFACVYLQCDSACSAMWTWPSYSVRTDTWTRMRSHMEADDNAGRGAQWDGKSYSRILHIFLICDFCHPSSSPFHPIFWPDDLLSVILPFVPYSLRSSCSSCMFIPLAAYIILLCWSVHTYIIKSSLVYLFFSVHFCCYCFWTGPRTFL